ncbi:rhomboid family intramembrane serine protease [Ectothiorhodospiraceae bacterium BW-2]|nr:rhomboid family intramembrane serine protease [Ectothiorhodospiraceae bacterium BW-2]
MFIPYSADLALGRLPKVSIAVMLLCCLIYWQQDRNDTAIENALWHFCTQTDLFDPPPERQQGKPERPNSFCHLMLRIIHTAPDPEHRLAEVLKIGDLAKSSNIEAAYRQFQQTSPPQSFTSQLLYLPESWWNIWRVITSSLAHSGFYHLLFNLIFFFAFAPALELIIDSHWRYLTTLLLMALAASWSYSVWVAAGHEATPSLGLSGVVTGLMGLSAWLMPKARIRTLLFWGIPPITVYIPAIWLVLFYVGADAFDLFTEGMSGSTNIVAHVFGGVGGYLIGLFWFNKRRREIAPELNEAIEEAFIRRRDPSGLHYHHPQRHQRFEQAQYERRAQHAFERYTEQLCYLADKGQHTEVISQLLKRFEAYQTSPEVYEELYQALCQLPDGRSQNCLARLLCHLYLQKSDKRSAARIAEQQIGRNPQFALGSYAEMMMLVEVLMNWQQYQAALNLLTQATARYPHDHQWVNNLLLEAELWLQGMGDRERCRDCFKILQQQSEQLSPLEKQQVIKALQRLLPSKPLFNAEVELNNSANP